MTQPLSQGSAVTGFGGEPCLKLQVMFSRLTESMCVIKSYRVMFNELDVSSKVEESTCLSLTHSHVVCALFGCRGYHPVLLLTSTTTTLPPAGRSQNRRQPFVLSDTPLCR
jgi:hypothetical protein